MSVGPYPSFPQLAGSTVTWKDDLVADRSSSGNVRVRAMYPTKKRIFEITHWLSVDDLADFEEHYDDNRLLAFSFTWALDGNGYLCVYGKPPAFSTNDAVFTEVKVELLEQ